MEEIKTLSLAVFMPNCQFQVILDKSQVSNIVDEIEEALIEQKISIDKEIEVIKNARDISIMLSNNEIDSSEAVTTMAYSFIYSYVTTVKSISDETVGIMAIFDNESINFISSEDLVSFQKGVNNTKKMYEDVLGDDLIDKTPTKPTIH